ncbi:MAG: YncE family protein [Candidatus Omnitrophica bacterium]|nr:YncE family protein [Candidatus Omnitrophota bacterium]MDE2008863.1 YncE family protein [Candidatus Omnitrophota bacterium]MDE2213574.1 YncE family protein [Candidatus Omnitrophota bacterium]MDE2230525.1 YncE family protein [Candidatus Omnitrophota bacterium]
MKEIIFLLLLFICPKLHAEDINSLQLRQTIILPNVQGRIDHMDIDTKGQRLFVAALENNTLEVIDLKTGKIVESIKGLSEPQDVRYISDPGQIFVTNGGSGVANILDAKTFKNIKSFKFPDADNLRFDAKNKLIYVAYGDGAIGIINSDSWRKVGDIELNGHPESFQVESMGSKIFANVPQTHQIAVLDKNNKTVVGSWPVHEGWANFPMALDEPDHRLFVGLREPPKLLVLDTGSGKTILSLTLGSDSDDIFYDPRRRRIYVSCGAGFIYVFKQIDADHYRFISKISTGRGARTSLFVPETKQLFVAIPRQGDQPAVIQIYEVK